MLRPAVRSTGAHPNQSGKLVQRRDHLATRMDDHLPHRTDRLGKDPHAETGGHDELSEMTVAVEGLGGKRGASEEQDAEYCDRT